MTRPWNETNADLKAEAEIADILAAKANDADGWFKLPIAYHFDVCLTAGSLVASFFEIKRRNNVSDDFRTALVAVQKIAAGQALEAATARPAYFAWRWSDGVITIQKVQAPSYVEIGGNSRGQDGDREPVGHYEIDRMIRIEP